MTAEKEHEAAGRETSMWRKLISRLWRPKPTTTTASGKARRKRIKTLNRAIFRLRVLVMLGGQCACCGESDPVMLTIDHRHGDGAWERLHHRGADYYRQMLKRPRAEQAYRIFCHNCHTAHNAYGECSHGRAERATTAAELERRQAERLHLLECGRRKRQQETGG